MLIFFGLFIVLIALAIFFVGMASHNTERVPTMVAAFFGGMIGVALCVLACVEQVEAGHVGITKWFGEIQMKTILQEGLNYKNPFVTVDEVSIRTETYTMSAVQDEGEKGDRDDSVTALSKDGMRMKMDVTIAYRMVPKDAPFIYRNFGESFVERILRPGMRAAVRSATAKYTAREAYSEKRDEMTLLMASELERQLADLLGKYSGFEGQGFVISSVMLRKIDLPAKVTAAIEAKLEAEQQAQQMEFVLQKEQKEAERKAIEADGIAKFQKIVSEGIDERLLKWKGIEATMELAKSPNSKVVVIGSGKDGLPIILGTEGK